MQIVIDADFGQFNIDKNRNFDNYTINANTANPSNISNFNTENEQGIKLYSINAYCDYAIKKYSVTIGGKLSKIDNKSRFSLYETTNAHPTIINENHFVYKIRASRVTHTQFKAGAPPAPRHLPTSLVSFSIFIEQYNVLKPN